MNTQGNHSHNWHNEPRTGRRSARSLRSSLWRGLLATTWFIAVGCSAAPMDFDADAPADVATQAQALDTFEWRTWASTSATTAIDSDPAVCTNTPGFVAVVRNSDQKFYFRRWALAGNPDWDVVGARTFASSPSCTMQYPYPKTDNRLLLAGKGTDNKIYTLEAYLPAFTTPEQALNPPNPTWKLGMFWQKVNDTLYPNSTNGHPALASNGSKVVLTFVNQMTVYAYARTLPYVGGVWGALQTAPSLAGATINGVPAITYMKGATNKFIVMVRAVSNGVSAFHWIYFDGTKFVGNWARATIPHTLNSDPALEYDTDFNALTVYFKSGNDVIQTSVAAPGDLGTGAYFPIWTTPDTTLAVGATPRVVFGGGIEASHRTIAIRGYDAQVAQADRSKGLLINHTFAGQDPF